MGLLAESLEGLEIVKGKVGKRKEKVGREFRVQFSELGNDGGKELEFAACRWIGNLEVSEKWIL